MLNKIWAGFFFAAFVAALVQALFLGNPGVFQDMVAAAFSLARTAFEIALGLTGVMCLWLGIMRVGEKGGAVRLKRIDTSFLDSKLIVEGEIVRIQGRKGRTVKLDVTSDGARVEDVLRFVIKGETPPLRETSTSTPDS